MRLRGAGAWWGRLVLLVVPVGVWAPAGAQGLPFELGSSGPDDPAPALVWRLGSGQARDPPPDPREGTSEDDDEAAPGGSTVPLGPEPEDGEGRAPGDAGVSTAGGGEGRAVTGSETEADPLSGELTVTARGMLVVTLGWASRRVVPGAYALYVVRPDVEGDQFQLSPANTVIGFSMGHLTLGAWKLSGALDMSLKSPSPQSRTVLAPLFYDIHLGLTRENAYLLVGQFPDVNLPFAPATTNGFPGSLLPGQIGFYRPMVRGGFRLPLGEGVDLRLQGALGRDVQNYEVSPLVFGGGAGYPDLQWRLGLGAGAPRRESSRPWRRRHGLSVGGHVGGRAFARADSDPLQVMERRTWALVADGHTEILSGTTLRARFWVGQTLSDYGAAIFQSVNADLAPIRAHGFWADLQQRLSARWVLALGYGRDDPRDGDLDPEQRALNEAAFANLYWHWSRRLTFAVEVGWWRTEWRELGDAEAWRGGALSALHF